MHVFDEGRDARGVDRLQEEPDQRRLGSPAVLGAGGVPHDGVTQFCTPAPVAGERSERGEAHAIAIRADSDRVHAGAADHGDRILGVRACTQQRMQVVLDDGSVRPGQRRDGRTEDGDLLREVEAREVQTDRRKPPRISCSECPAGELVDHRDRLLQTIDLGAGSWPSLPGEDLARGGEQHHIRLGTASVDREHQLAADVVAHAHSRKRALAASSRSVSFSARSCCSTSGCARIARSTRSRPPPIAASSARRS